MACPLHLPSLQPQGTAGGKWFISAPCRAVALGNLYRHLPTQTILWFLPTCAHTPRVWTSASSNLVVQTQHHPGPCEHLTENSGLGMANAPPDLHQNTPTISKFSHTNSNQATEGCTGLQAHALHGVRQIQKSLCTTTKAFLCCLCSRCRVASLPPVLMLCITHSCLALAGLTCSLLNTRQIVDNLC